MKLCKDYLAEKWVGGLVRHHSPTVLQHSVLEFVTTLHTGVVTHLFHMVGHHRVIRFQGGTSKITKENPADVSDSLTPDNAKETSRSCDACAERKLIQDHVGH